MKVSVIVPARNEAAALGDTLRSLVIAARTARASIEIIVVDSASTDGTAELARSFTCAEAAETAWGASRVPIRVAVADRPGAGRARNLGAELAAGDVLVFVDADTRVPADAFSRTLTHVHAGYQGGLTRLGALDGGRRARLWWAFWNVVRALPIARAKAMSAFMFSTRDAFDTFGPFDESVQISEEWPLLAGLWRARRDRFVYDRELTVLSSARRMEIPAFGYTRTFVKYAWAVLHSSGRARYPDRFRHPPAGTETPRRWRLRLAALVAGTAMHDLDPVRVDGRRWFHKRRRRARAPLLPLWNLWLAICGEPVRVVSGTAWHDRENAVHRALYGQDVRPAAHGGLLIPYRPGVPADAVPGGPVDHADRVITAAARALAGLHTAGQSHGDAVLRNVLLDPATGTAAWIDFETRHRDALPEPCRRADDLWTLARSAVLTLGPGRAEPVAAAIVAASLDPATRAALADCATDPAHSVSVLALARSPLVGVGLAELRRAVLRHCNATHRTLGA
ncbi:glycosyltransferase [Nocardia sp. NPDC005978]|uniref:glycosyltransferase n=1 Tax=Nocardia sp. NPDC005978 TaxID=3156725 RepID=UPI0033A2FD4B